jgi:hypothetical protein
MDPLGKAEEIPDLKPGAVIQNNLAGEAAKDLMLIRLDQSKIGL